MQGLDGSRPFVLLDDARAGGAGVSRLFTHPRGVITAHMIDQVPAALEQLRLAAALGRTAAGFISYEAGLALESRLRPLYQPPADDLPLIWMALFDSVEQLTPAQVASALPDAAGAWIGKPQPRIGYGEYQALVEQALALIAAGDIYQVNLTFQSLVHAEGDPLALYALLRRTSAAGWGGVVRTDRHWLLSASPELFFTVEGGVITARPMKGTAGRGANLVSDGEAVETLRTDPKQRAENLMITDLIRNDLSRVAEPGSVNVPSLFDVETYPTIHQLTSTVTARLDEGLSPVDVLAAIFPCGSITGAPKIRAMEVIAALEGEARGAYTGGIGWLNRDESGFNVAIRTLVLPQEPGPAMLGLGSGIVADSEPASEWGECLAKGAFVSAGNAPFDLIETMRFDPRDGIAYLALHLRRLEASASTFGFAFNRHNVRNELQAAVFTLRQPVRVRLLLGPSGATAIETAPLPPPVIQPVSVALALLPVSSSDFRLRHKTTARGFYDQARRASGAHEIVFTDAGGMLTEGSFTNIFVERDGLLLTPPLHRGLLPGTLRQHLIDEGRAIEADLTPRELAGGFFIGNALRGLMRAELVATPASAGL